MSALSKWAIVCAVGIVGIVLFLHDSKLELEAHDTSADSSVSRTPINKSKDSVEANPTENPIVGAYSVSNENFTEGQNSLVIKYGPSSPQLASYTLEWSHACANSAQATQESDAEEVMRKFCDGLEPLSETEAVALYKYSVRVDFSRRLSAREQAAGVDAAMDYAEDYIKRAEDPFSLRAGMDYLARIDVLSPPMSKKHAQSQQQLYEIYRMARDSYICDLYGGCSANSAVAAQFCLETNCRQLTDYQQQVRNQLSRADLETFNWYLAAMRSLRK